MHNWRVTYSDHGVQPQLRLQCMCSILQPFVFDGAAEVKARVLQAVANHSSFEDTAGSAAATA